MRFGVGGGVILAAGAGDEWAWVLATVGGVRGRVRKEGGGE